MRRGHLWRQWLQIEGEARVAQQRKQQRQAVRRSRLPARVHVGALLPSAPTRLKAPRFCGEKRPHFGRGHAYHSAHKHRMLLLLLRDDLPLTKIRWTPHTHLCV